MKNVTVGLGVKWLKALKTVANTMAKRISIKYTDIITFLTFELLVRIGILH